MGVGCGKDAFCVAREGARYKLSPALGAGESEMSRIFVAAEAATTKC